MLREAGVGQYLGQVVALRTHRVRPGDAGVGIGKRIRDQSARDCRLAELIVALEDVRVDRSVRTVRAGAAELAIVVAVMAVRAEQLRAHQRAQKPVPFSFNMFTSRLGCGSGLRRAWVTGWLERGRRREFRNDVQRVRRPTPLAWARSRKSISRCLPVLVPWQRRQVSY